MSTSSEIKVVGLVRLPDKRCRYVVLTNRNFEHGQNEIIESDVNWDDYKTSNNEIYWGYSAETPHPIYPSQTTVLLPVENASEIHLRFKGDFRFCAYSIIT